MNLRNLAAGALDLLATALTHAAHKLDPPPPVVKLSITHTNARHDWCDHCNNIHPVATIYVYTEDPTTATPVGVWRPCQENT